MDFEEQLDMFFVRKDNEFVAYNTNYTSSNQQLKKNIFTCIPILVKYIQNLTNASWIEGSNNVVELFPGRVYFRNCIVYGKIMNRGNHSESRYNYLLDDGTGCLNISIPRRTEDMDNIGKLENELQAIKNGVLATQNENQIFKSLQSLLSRTKQQIDKSNLANGVRVLLYGRPNSYRGQISFNVFCLIEDNTIERDVEIAFKDFFIEWFKKNT